MAAFDNAILYEQLQQANAELEERVVQRTRELTALVEYQKAPDPDDATPDFRGKAAPQMSQLVRYRRDRDKIGPLVRSTSHAPLHGNTSDSADSIQ